MQKWCARVCVASAVKCESKQTSWQNLISESESVSKAFLKFRTLWKHSLANLHTQRRLSPPMTWSTKTTEVSAQQRHFDQKVDPVDGKKVIRAAALARISIRSIRFCQFSSDVLRLKLNLLYGHPHNSNHLSPSKWTDMPPSYSSFQH